MNTTKSKMKTVTICIDQDDAYIIRDALYDYAYDHQQDGVKTLGEHIFACYEQTRGHV